MKRSLYRIERRRRGHVTWLRGLAEGVTRVWADGYLACEDDHYPGDDLRIIDMESGEVVKTQDGHGPASTASV
jgi:ribosomal protein S18 acetylase RimI-like enzyme